MCVGLAATVIRVKDGKIQSTWVNDEPEDAERISW